MSFVKKIQINILLLLSVSRFLVAECDMHHLITFCVEPVSYFGQIMGSSPVFVMQGGTWTSTWSNTYSISTNGVNKKVVAFLDADMPQHTSLQVSLTAPKGARTLGMQTLSATPVDLVLEVSMVGASGLPMNYTFKSNPKAGVVPDTTRIVTYTLVDG